MLLGDVFLLGLSLWLALLIRNLGVPSMPYFLEHLSAFVAVFSVSVLIFFIAGLYEHQTRLVKRILGARIAGAQLANVLIAAVVFFLLPFDIAPKTILALYLVISVVLISVWRFFLVPSFSIARQEPALLIGTGPEVDRVLQDINTHKKYYIRFVEHIDTATYTDLVARIHEKIAEGVRLIVLDSRDPKVAEVLPQLYEPMVTGVVFSEFSAFYEDLFDRVSLGHVDYAWLLECLPKKRFAYDITKRAFDFVGACIGGVIAIPFILVAALLLMPGGQPFIFHNRIGKQGKLFQIVKLRTMLFNDHGDPVRQRENRVTALGRILRKTRIDELPQLYNIAKGELSFIGPRPELPEIAKVYEQNIPYYHVRHLITPGLSGWAQIHDYDAPRGGADVERTSRKVSYDLYYLKHRSFGLDMAIALKTLRALASFSGV